MGPFKIVLIDIQIYIVYKERKECSQYLKQKMFINQFISRLDFFLFICSYVLSAFSGKSLYFLLLQKTVKVHIGADATLWRPLHHIQRHAVHRGVWNPLADPDAL